MISYHEDLRLFHLRGNGVSMVLGAVRDGNGHDEIVMPYFGAPLDGVEDIPALMNWREGASFDSLRQVMPYALPTEGRGDNRPVMLAADDGTGCDCTEMYWEGAYTITPGKPALAGLPATYTESPDEAETLTLFLRDPVTELEAALSYTLFAAYPAIACSMRLVNRGSAVLTLRQAASMTLTLDGRWDMLHLHGAWARERGIERVPAASLTRQIESVRGASGHEHNPFAALVMPGTDEFTGEAVGMSLVYSGDHRIAVDENAYGTTRMVAGLNPRTFAWRLAPGESFQTPEAVCVYSGSGLNGMSQAYHALYRTRLVRGLWRDRERPILINNWEATYFGFDHEKLMTIARTARDVGVELFVLDDGWFGRRDSDNCSLGDWTPDLRKLPHGLRRLAEDMNGLGLRFGLWFEPEMVSPDSDLYRAHPDWCLHVPGRPRTEARQQLVLDLSRTEVQDHIIGAVSDVLRSAPIGYVKWDMNRNFKEAGSPSLRDGRGGELHHRYMLGLYRVLEAVTSAFPEVLFESCSGGGGRFDAGMLYYMPQTWTSDDTDAAERVKIQYGTSVWAPASAMGAHVSAVPNHQTGRITPIETRGHVAMGGNFGYELDLSRQSPEDLAVIREQVAFVKKVRRTTRQGTFTRLLSPYEGNVASWQFADADRVLLFAFRRMNEPGAGPVRIRLRGLPAGMSYRDGDGRVHTAESLMTAGLTVSFGWNDFASRMIELEAVR